MYLFPHPASLHVLACPCNSLGRGQGPKRKCHCEACFLGRSNLIIFAFCIFNFLSCSPVLLISTSCLPDYLINFFLFPSPFFSAILFPQHDKETGALSQILFTNDYILNTNCGLMYNCGFTINIYPAVNGYRVRRKKVIILGNCVIRTYEQEIQVKVEIAIDQFNIFWESEHGCSNIYFKSFRLFCLALACISCSAYL